VSSPTPTPAAPGAKAHDQRPDRRWLVLAFVAVAQLMVVLDATVVNIALPSAQRDLGFADSDRQWIVTAYALAFGSLLLLGGRIGDLFGRKWTFIGGLIGFGIVSALGGIADSFGVLVAARALQGVFGAVLAPAALATLISTFTDPADRRKAFGVFGSVAVGGGAVGLILGGVLTEYLSWRWCLGVNLVFALVAAVGAAFVMRNSRPAVRPKLDVVGTILASFGLFGLVYGFSHAETDGWGDAVTVSALAVGVLLIVSFVATQTRVAHPLLPLRIVTDRARGGAYLSVGLAGIAMFGLFLFMTYYLQLVKGYSPVASGLAFLPMIAAIMISSNVSTIITLPRFGARNLIFGGMVLGAIGMLVLTQLDVDSSYPFLVMPTLVVLGLAMGSIISPSFNTATLGVPPQDAGVASAMVNTTQQVGGSIGTALLSTIAASATTGYLADHPGSGPAAQAVAATHGYAVAFGTSAGLFVVGAIAALTIIPSQRRDEERAKELLVSETVAVSVTDELEVVQA
jgi:EmrB/QacA subfamily drug resistance transporter